MLIGLLETGRVPEDMVPDHGDYPTQFGEIYRSVDPSVRVATYAVIDGIFPKRPDECDAWLITGSKYGVYDDEPWIEPLKTCLREIRAANVPIIGICFGHQIMAEAFGGRAEKFHDGWACGVHDYAVTSRPEWMADASGAFAMHAMHQDQVTGLPDDATVLASSPFCQNAMLAYGDPDAPDAISIQPHPEFAMAYAKDLVELRAGELIPPERSEPAMASFGKAVDNIEFVKWSLAYLRKVLGDRTAA
jgi:GMP synthase (glutamine-hydrolysing)